MPFVTYEHAAGYFRGKSVALVGSAPSVLGNDPGLVDSYDVVCRVNNYKLGTPQGERTDVHYSFYGTSIRNTRADLIRDGVKLCWCKCPNAKPIESAWHERNGKQAGIDFRYIYRNRARWWFCDTYVPDAASFLAKFELLDGHIPTTGFAAILDLLSCAPQHLYLTGFDFFTSGLHNVNERWRDGDPRDPIGHRPGVEAQWLANNALLYPVSFDPELLKIMRERRGAGA